MRVIREFDPWRSPLCTCPPKYSLQPYTGCSHGCLYCYATGYIRLRKARPKRDVVAKIRRDLRYIDFSLPINMSTSSDPYTPEEATLGLTRRILEILLPIGLRVLITTKSSSVVRDVDILSKGNAAVMITITTMDKGTARRIEPHAPPPRDRIRALRLLSENGIPVGVRIDPIIPHVNDDEEELIELVENVVAAGASHVVTSTYKARPDSLSRLILEYPELSERLRRLYLSYGERLHGYWYLERRLRIRILTPIIRHARKLGITVATCRDGIKNYAPTCDGSHLIPKRVPLSLSRTPKIRA